MPGHAHKIDVTILDNMQLRCRDASIFIVNNESFETIVKWAYKGQPSNFIIKKYQFVQINDWDRLLKATLLLKLSYFELNESYPLKALEALYFLCSFSLGCSLSDIRKMVSVNVGREQKHMAEWIIKCYKLIQKKKSA